MTMVILNTAEPAWAAAADYVTAAKPVSEMLPLITFT